MSQGTGILLLSHMAGECTTLATCWKVTRRDGQVFGFTDHTSDLDDIDGIDYESLSGFMPSAVPTSSGMNVDTVELTGGFVTAAVTDADVRAGLWVGATGELFLVNYMDKSMGVHKLRRFQLGEVRSGRYQFSVELRSLLYKMQQQIGREVQPGCHWDLGDSHCGINLSTFPRGRVSATVTAITSRQVFTCAALTDAAGWFSEGRVEFDPATGGLNAGIKAEIKTYHGSGVIELQEPLPYDLGGGDSLIAQAGCDKARDGGCSAAKFNNVINFGGYPDLPGLDAALNGL